MSATVSIAEHLRQNREIPHVRERTLELLIQVAEEAWQRYPARNQIRPRREHVRAVLKGDLTWILLESINPEALVVAVVWLLNQARRRRERDIAELRVKIYGAPAQTTADPSTETVPPGTHPSTTSPLSEQDPQEGGAPTVASAALDARAQERLAARLRVETRLSRLDTVLVDGRPIGDCTVAQARAWATRRRLEMREAGRDQRFALALISNLGSGEIIRHHWRNAEEVDALYDKAEAEYSTL